MKKLALMGCLVALSAPLCLADNTAPAPTAKKVGPCKQIIQTCEQGGYQKGMHKKDGKGLYKDCLDPILAGQPVSGVTVDPAVVSACQAMRAKHQQKKQSTPVATPAAQ